MARTPVMAAGGIVLRREKNPRIAVVRLRKRNEWVLPKGKLDDGETPREAAEREVLEETGHDVSVHEFLGTLVYESSGGFKVVHYWRMQAGGEQTHELMHDIREVDWLPLDSAVERLSRTYERAFLANVGPIALQAAASAEPARRSRAKPAAAKPAAPAAKPAATVEKPAAAVAKRRTPRVAPPAPAKVVAPAPAAPIADTTPAASPPDIIEVPAPVAPAIVEVGPEVAEPVQQSPVMVENDPASEAVGAEAVEAESADTEMPVAEAERAEAETPDIETVDDKAELDSDGSRMVAPSPEPEPATAESPQAELATPDSTNAMAENPDQGTRSLVRKVRDWLRRAA
jgi:8-oxo-dGTP diphosphatase